MDVAVGDYVGYFVVILTQLFSSSDAWSVQMPPVRRAVQQT
jgi:hypothetical protein